MRIRSLLLFYRILVLGLVFSFTGLSASASIADRIEGLVASSSTSVYVLGRGGKVLSKFSAADMSLVKTVTLDSKAAAIRMSGETPVLLSLSGVNLTLESFDPATLESAGEAEVIVRKVKNKLNGGGEDDELPICGESINIGPCREE